MAWTDIVGHERPLEGFRRVVARGRLAHAYLFVGPAGVGKRLFARELARALLCEAPDHDPAALEACERCDGCKQVDAGTHPDFFTLRRPEEANEMPTELLRELCRGFSLKPARGRGKVALLDDADDLNEESANCFLKTLEEPPPGSVFVLLGTSPDRQLATILSRCQTVRFAPLPAEQVRAVLQRHGIDEPARLDRLVRLAGGSPRQALELSDETLWSFRRDLLSGLAQPRIDVQALSKAFISFAEEAGKEGAAQRRRANRALRLLIESFNDALAVAYGAAPRSSGAEELPLVEALAVRAGSEKIVAALERCLETETQLGRYVQLSLVLEGLNEALAQLLERTGPAPIRLGGLPV